MRIIQTFWSGGRDPLQYGYGWRHAEHNLMSWALSCCSLREHYDQVELYTDQRGYDVLIEKLHLPYTAVHVVYDDHLCLPQHWAYAKIKTYSMQTEPFLHVDGDVYISKPFPEEVHNAPLVVQNKEICTEYYNELMNHILSIPNLYLPEDLEKDINKKKISSFNMGIFGGNDIEFIQFFCHKVTKFLMRNNIIAPLYKHGEIDCNIFLEQILFSMYSKYFKKPVCCILQSEIKDNGYYGKNFCDLEHTNEHSFFHIIGGHKRTNNVCIMLKNAIYLKCADTYSKILSLFPYRNIRFDKNSTARISLEAERYVAQYEDFLNSLRKEWIDIPLDIIRDWSYKAASSIYLLESKIKKCKYVLSIHPRLTIYEMASFWPVEALTILRNRLGKDKHFYLKAVGISPCLEENGIRETPLSCVGFNIVSYIQENITDYDIILKNLLKGFV
ncbi:MAG: DUF6734 family protein, partial [Bacteroidaceae bacterium]|nr:DUF6734 family protein [Bacteroidaceae bacterium]